MAKKPLPSAGGRPTNASLGGERMEPVGFRCTRAQAEKLDALGGAAWLRAQIDAAPKPRIVKR